MYGTFSRRFGLPDKVRVPADAIRKLKGDVAITEDGQIVLTGHKYFAGNPHINVTLDRPVVKHSKGDWNGGDAYLFSTKDFLTTTKGGSLKSIEPSDMFANGADVIVNPKQVTLISGDVAALERAREAGMQTLSSPRLRRLFETENNNYQSAISSYAQPFLRRIAKPPKHTLGLPYATEIQRLQSMRGTPTFADFELLEQQTGLNAGVAPIKEHEKALISLDKMLNATPSSIMEGTVKPYTYPNGREVGFDYNSIMNELKAIQQAKYNNVFYDPASHVEFNWREQMGITQ